MNERPATIGKLPKNCGHLVSESGNIGTKTKLVDAVAELPKVRIDSMYAYLGMLDQQVLYDQQLFPRVYSFDDVSPSQMLRLFI